MPRYTAVLQSVATLVGTTIGAGVLGLPYVFNQAGFWTGVFVLVIIATAMLFINLMFGEITLRTNGRHQIAGYIGKYLGHSWQKVISVFITLTIYGALLAYFVGVGESLAAVFGGHALLWRLIFYLIASFFVFKGIRLVKKTELFLGLLIVFAFIIISLFALPQLKLENLAHFDISRFLIPYGIVLFACSAIVAIPEMREILMGKEKLLKKSIIVGVLIPTIIYFLFTLSVVGITGAGTTEIATLGLGKILGEKILVLGNLLAFLTMSTCFLTLALALKEQFNYDFKIPHFWSWLLTLSGPLVLYFLGWQDFAKIIGIIGGLGIGTEGLIYLLTYWRARKKGQRQPEYHLSSFIASSASLFLIIVFLGGLIYVALDII